MMDKTSMETNNIRSTTLRIKRVIFRKKVWMDLFGMVILGMPLIIMCIVPAKSRDVQTEDWHLYNFKHVAKAEVSDITLYRLLGFGYILFMFMLELLSYLSYVHDKDVQRQHYVESATKKTNVNSGSYFATFCWAAFVNRQLTMLLSNGLAMILTEMITETFKITVGRPRPDFLARCNPLNFDPYKPDYSILGLQPDCTGNYDLVDDGRKSFPSGHASMAYCVFTFGALIWFFLSAKTCLRKMYAFRAALFFVILIPAYWCGISRLSDHRHHAEDIIVGTFIGILFPCICYYLYYGFNPDKLYTVDYLEKDSYKDSIMTASALSIDKLPV